MKNGTGKEPGLDRATGFTGTGSSLSEFEAAFGEPFEDLLNPDKLTPGDDLTLTYRKLEEKVAESIRLENGLRKTIRAKIFPALKTAIGAPKNAGVYQAQLRDLEHIHRGLLFNGGVTACDGNSVVHDTLPLTITQIGLCLVSYSGAQNAWLHQLFRRDLASHMNDPVEEVLAVLERREKREAQGYEGNDLSDLARRGLMTYLERAVLREKASSNWRMGHGSVAPYEILTGLWSSQRQAIRRSLEVIRWYVLEHKRFVFVPSAPRKKHWLTIGNALRPLEYAIVQTLETELESLVKNGGYREASGVKQEMEKFQQEIGPQVVVGLYRAWEAAPPYLFYAHADYADLAAHIALADSVLQEHRGFPMLIDLADQVCKTNLGADSFTSSVQMAYANAGEPYRYLGERETRR